MSARPPCTRVVANFGEGLGMGKERLLPAGYRRHSIGAEEVPEVPVGVHALPTGLDDLRLPE